MHTQHEQGTASTQDTAPLSCSLLSHATLLSCWQPGRGPRPPSALARLQLLLAQDVLLLAVRRQQRPRLRVRLLACAAWAEGRAACVSGERGSPLLAPPPLPSWHRCSCSSTAQQSSPRGASSTRRVLLARLRSASPSDLADLQSNQHSSVANPPGASSSSRPAPHPHPTHEPVSTNYCEPTRRLLARRVLLVQVPLWRPLAQAAAVDVGAHRVVLPLVQLLLG